MRMLSLTCLLGAAMLCAACGRDGGSPSGSASSPGSAPAADVEAPAVARLTGTVGYRQRIALPPGAEVTVRLEDISLADAKSVVLAEQTFLLEGQVPAAFELEYDPAQVDPRHRYALRAEIRVDGDLWFTTTRVNPVLNDAGTSPRELMLDMVREP